MLLVQVAWVRRMESRGIKNYPKRFQSAEGCYSHRAAAQPGIRIKMAHKQFVGLTVATLPPPSLDPLPPQPRLTHNPRMRPVTPRYPSPLPLCRCPQTTRSTLSTAPCGSAPRLRRSAATRARTGRDPSSNLPCMHHMHARMQRVSVWTLTGARARGISLPTTYHLVLTTCPVPLATSSLLLTAHPTHRR